MNPVYKPVDASLTAMSNSTAVALQNATTNQQNAMLMNLASMVVWQVEAAKAVKKAVSG